MSHGGDIPMASPEITGELLAKTCANFLKLSHSIEIK
jgi:hypothetical protein